MENLHRKFVELGRQRHRLLNEMLAILPEIYESGIWRKYAETIVEYAGKFGGISKSAVLKRLRLEKYLVDKPALKEAIKTAGVNKVAMVAAIATPQTDRAFADKVENPLLKLCPGNCERRLTCAMVARKLIQRLFPHVGL